MEVTVGENHRQKLVVAILYGELTVFSLSRVIGVLFKLQLSYFMTHPSIYESF